MPVPDITLETPRRWSPVAFAFLGDAVWELYVRRAFFAPPARPLDYDLKCKRAVRAEAQDAALRHLIEVGHFADEELRVVKWGRNASYGNVPTRLRGKGKGGHAIYRNASALECVVGYLYMTDMERLEATMARLGGRGSWRQSRRRRRGGRDRSRGAGGGSDDEGDGAATFRAARVHLLNFLASSSSRRPLAPRGRLPFSRDRVMRFALAPCC